MQIEVSHKHMFEGQIGNESIGLKHLGVRFSQGSDEQQYVHYINSGSGGTVSLPNTVLMTYFLSSQLQTTSVSCLMNLDDLYSKWAFHGRLF